MNNTRFSLALFLTLALVGAQAIVLQHDHAGYLSQHADCSICIKQSAESDALPETDSAFDVLGQEALFSAELGSAHSETPLVTRARGPPLVISWHPLLILHGIYQATY